MRPRLLDFLSSLDESPVKSASQKAFKSLPDLTKVVSKLTVLEGVGPATASAVLAAYAPDVYFMSDEAMEASLANCKDYSLKQYLLFADKLQAKAKSLLLQTKIVHKRRISIVDISTAWCMWVVICFSPCFKKEETRS